MKVSLAWFTRLIGGCEVQGDGVAVSLEVAQVGAIGSQDIGVPADTVVVQQ
jgi:hypothetical protein